MISDNKENVAVFVNTLVSVYPNYQIIFEDHIHINNGFLVTIRDAISTASITCLIRLCEDSDEVVATTVHSAINMLTDFITQGV